MELGINGKLALVTGAGGDIGRAAAIALAAEGARLLLTDVERADLRDSVTAIRDATGLTSDTAVADLTDPDSIADLIGVANRQGGADLCVHAAGITGAKGDPLELGDDDWYEAWTVDFMAAVRIARAVVPAMVDKGWGRVVFVSSENAVQPYGDEMPYNAAKAALANFTKGTAQLYAPRGVLINAVAPAFIATNMTDAMMQERAAERGTGVDEAIESFLAEDRPHLVLERRGSPQEVAAVIAFLCSDLASFVVGSTYRVDGGSVLSVAT
jgi:NAD(P)-dependent dehydrogenase (short-subunit alcohol dehydrogenase family)